MVYSVNHMYSLIFDIKSPSIILPSKNEYRLLLLSLLKVNQVITNDLTTTTLPHTLPSVYTAVTYTTVQCIHTLYTLYRLPIYVTTVAELYKADPLVNANHSFIDHPPRNMSATRASISPMVCLAAVMLTLAAVCVEASFPSCFPREMFGVVYGKEYYTG